MGLKDRWAQVKDQHEAQQAELHEGTYKQTQFQLSMNRGPSHICADWSRLGGVKITINGTGIEELIERDRANGVLAQPEDQRPIFQTLEELGDFFKRHILSNMNEDAKKQSAESMMTFMHQGALYAPVSAAASVCFSGKEFGPAGTASRDDNQRRGQIRELNINSTAAGFKVQEIVTQNFMTYTINAGDKAGDLIQPDAGSDYIYKAIGTVDVDFSKNPASPDLTVIDNAISYGSKMVEPYLDNRSFLSKFVDKVKEFLYGKMQVEKLPSPVMESPSDTKGVEPKIEMESSKINFGNE